MNMLSILVAATLAGELDSSPKALQAIEDSAITARVETQLMVNEQVTSLNINTDTRDGRVELTGGVKDEYRKNLAGDLAASVHGVKGVDNQLLIVPDPAKQKKLPLSTRFKDRAVAASIRSRLLFHKEWRGFRLGVLTRDGKVTLTGVTPTPEEKERIETIAWETRGVDEVDNQITVRRKGQIASFPDAMNQVSDELLEKRVETSLLMNSRVGIRKMDVEVNDGVVILTGEVKTQPQRELAEVVVKHLRGVGVVQNDLTVRDRVTVATSKPAVFLDAMEPEPRSASLTTQELPPIEAPAVMPPPPEYSRPAVEEPAVSAPSYEETFPVSDDDYDGSEPLVRGVTYDGRP